MISLLLRAPFEHIDGPLAHVTGHGPWPGRVQSALAEILLRTLPKLRKYLGTSPIAGGRWKSEPYVTTARHFVRVIL